MARALSFRAELVAVAALVVLAAVLRFVGLPARGSWDSDQGTEMLVLLGIVRDHVVPLLGPQTSIGGFHHGVLYYWLLAPAALVSGADPTAVVAEIAALATVGIVPVWWLARAIGGSRSGVVAAGLFAVSATGIATATTIWNPSLAPVASALALAAAWHGSTTGRASSWFASAAAFALATHAHVLSAVLLVPLAGLLLTADAARRSRRWAIVTGLGCLAIVLVSWLPLLAYDVANGFPETRSLLAFVTAAGSGGGGGGLDPVSRVVLVGLRVAAWPLSGLVTLGPAAPVAAIVALALVLAGLASLLRSADPVRRRAGAFIAFTFGWSVVALSVAVSGLQTVVPRLPVDQAHAFLDPLVLVTAGVALGASGRVATSIAAVLVVLLVAWNVGHWPPVVAPDGGWPAGQAAAAAAEATLDATQPIPIAGLPVFKRPDEVAFPLRRDGYAVDDRTDDPALAGAAASRQLVVVCDDAFSEAIGAHCGGPAEDARAASTGLPLAARIHAAPDRWISVYRAP